MARGDIVGNIVYAAWSPKPWNANRADGTYVGNFVSVAEAESALESTLGVRNAKWSQDVRVDGVVSYTGVAP